ncbi:hypothetical protein [Campylobacter sp. 7477a]|uniref:hypothetical protein n=1 Tax=Campylobacter sp. 7477a TaxID=2735741 RepID=UPI003014FE1E|nr:hypothetical protein [Campylobacter sp. 7477a]
MFWFKNLFLALFVTLFLSGCGYKFFGTEYGYKMDDETKTAFNEVMRLKVDCSECSQNFLAKTITINGREYTSDVAIKCCLSKNLIDTDIGLKKVYIHRITDSRESAKGIEYTNKYDQKWLYDTRPSLEALFYTFLEDELNSRGILVVGTQTSPYTYRLDFDFRNFWATYDYDSKILSGRLSGNLVISNINFKRNLGISTKQQVKRLNANQAKDFDFFVALLVKQAAIKVAGEISKI